MAIVFVEKKYILPKDMTNSIDKYSFTDLPMAKKEKNTREKVVLLMYKNNTQIKKRDLSTFHKTNLLLL